MSFSSYTKNCSYNDSGPMYSSTNLLPKRPVKKQKKYAKYFPEIKSKSKRGNRRLAKSLNSSFEGKIKIDKANYRYCCVKSGFRGNYFQNFWLTWGIDYIRVSDQTTGSLSFIMLENSQMEDKTPKSFQKNMKNIIDHNRKFANYGRSIIFRKKRKPKFTNHSHSDKFFSKIRNQVKEKEEDNKKPNFLLKGKSINCHQKYREYKRKKRQKKAKSSYIEMKDFKRKNKKMKKKRTREGQLKGKIPVFKKKKTKENEDTGMDKRMNLEIIIQPPLSLNNLRKKNSGSYKETNTSQNLQSESENLSKKTPNKSSKEVKNGFMFPIIKITKEPSQEENNVNSTTDSNKVKQPRYGLWSMKADKVIAKKAQYGYEEDLFYNSANNSQHNSDDEGDKSPQKEIEKKTPIGSKKNRFFLPIMSSSAEKKPKKRRIHHKPSRSCLINSGFKIDEDMLIKPKNMIEISGCLPLDEIEKEDEKRYNAVKNYKTEIISAPRYTPYRSSSCNKQVRWVLTEEQKNRETKVRKKRRGSPSAKSMRNKQTKKQIQVIEIKGDEGDYDKKAQLLNLPNISDSPPPVGRNRRRVRKANSHVFTGGFGSML